MKWIATGILAGFLGANAQPAANLAIVHEPALDAYIAKVGAELGEHLPYWTVVPSGSYRFTVYDDRKAMAREPITAPGGEISVPLSLLAGADVESVFVFQLAHAMAHVALGHSARYAARLREMQERGTVRMPGSADSNARFLRQCELEADSAGADMLLESGYGLDPVVRYLEGLPASGVGPGRITGSDRAEVVRREMKKITAPAGGGDPAPFEKAREVALRVRSR